MSYDPYQAYAQMGPYSGITAQNPYATLQMQQPNLNPLTAAALGFSANIPNAGMYQGGQLGALGLPNQGGINLQQLQLAAALLAAQGANPQSQGLQNHPFGGGVNNPLLNPQLAGPQYGYQQHGGFGQIGQNLGQYGSPYGQMGSPFGQQANNPFQNNQGFGQGLPYGAPLAPQSWIGQAGIYGAGQPFAQANPLQQSNQWGQRPFQMQGISPWGY